MNKIDAAVEVSIRTILSELNGLLATSRQYCYRTFELSDKEREEFNKRLFERFGGNNTEVGLGKLWNELEEERKLRND